MYLSYVIRRLREVVAFARMSWAILSVSNLANHGSQLLLWLYEEERRKRVLIQGLSEVPNLRDVDTYATLVIFYRIVSSISLPT